MPTLNTNYLVPDPASAYMKAAQVTNYLTQNKLAQERLANLPAEREREASQFNLNQKIKQAQLENYLFQKKADAERLQREKEVHEAKKIAASTSLWLKAVTAPTKDIGSKMAKRLGFDIEWIGPDVKIVDPKNRITLQGPSVYVAETLNRISQDPSWLTNEPMTVETPNGPIQTTKFGSLGAWMAAHGVSATREDIKKKPLQTWKTPEGKFVNLPQGEAPPRGSLKVNPLTPKEEVPSKKVPDTVKTALSNLRFLKSHVDSSTGAIIDTILKATTQGNKIDATMVDSLRDKIPPELQGLYDASLEIVNKYYGVQTTPTPETTGKVYDFVPGEGLVERK